MSRRVGAGEGAEQVRVVGLSEDCQRLGLGLKVHRMIAPRLTR
jgi:hypothetical protein